MGAMNRQLQAQLDGAGSRTSAGASGADGDLLVTAGSTGLGASAAGARRAATASTWLEQLAGETEGHKPLLVHLKKGRTFLVEGGYRREVRSGLLVATLEQAFGVRSGGLGPRVRPVDRRYPGRGARGPTGAAIRHRRRQAAARSEESRSPTPSAATRSAPPEGPGTQHCQANVSRAKFQQAMYGKYQADRLRSADRSAGGN